MFRAHVYQRAKERHLFAGTQAVGPSLQSLSVLDDFPFSGPASEALQNARMFASSKKRRIPLSFAFLLYGLVNLNDLAFPQPAVAWLKRRLKEASGYERERDIFTRRLNVLGSELIDGEKANSGSESLTPTNITPGCLQVFQRAQILAGERGDNQIQANNILIALLSKDQISEAECG